MYLLSGSAVYYILTLFLGAISESILLFNTHPSNPDAPKIEDLKWHSAFFRKQLSGSLGRTMKISRKKTRDKDRSSSTLKPLHSRSGCSDKRKEMPSVDFTYSAEKVIAKVAPVQQKNETSMPDHRKRRDSRSQCDLVRAELKEKPHKQHHKGIRPGELSDRQGESKKSPSQCSGKTAALFSKKSPAGNSLAKYSGSLIKIRCKPSSSIKVPTSPVKNWGGFRIPKKGDRPLQKTEPCQSKSSCQYLGLVSSNDRTKNKLKLVSDNDGYIPDAEMSDSETESTDKCSLQRLSSSGSINHGYETDIIRRSILAS